MFGTNKCPRKLLLAVCLTALTLLICATAAADVDLDVDRHTVDEIDAFIRSHSTAYSGSFYDQQPVTTAPYAPGTLKSAYLKASLNALNQVRYVAGIGSQVKLDPEYNAMCQAGVLVNAVNGQITHYPSQPAKMADDLYQLGKEGTSSSNLGWGYSDLADALFRGWIHDGDSSNIDRLGHRRWVLDPRMTTTGFGQVDSHTAMYAFGYEWGASVPRRVAWPAQVMPFDWMSSSLPWSLDFMGGGLTDPGSVTVTIVREQDGAAWSFSSAKADGYFNINSDGYGGCTAVIFRPSGITYSAGDLYTVTVTGAESEPVVYQVFLYSASVRVPAPPTNPYSGAATVNGANYQVNGKTLTARYLGPEKATVTKVTVPDTVEVKGAVYKVTEIAPSACYALKSLRTVSVGQYVRTIGKNAFAKCAALTKVTGCKGVVTLGANVFMSCSKLTTVPAFTKLETIGANAFRSCPMLRKITLGTKVTKIGASAFRSCKTLMTITVKTKALTASKIGASAFKMVPKDATVICPAAKLKTYKTLFVKKGMPAVVTFR